MLKHMINFYLKDIRELTRDTKTLIFAILVPTLLTPIIMFSATSIFSGGSKESKALNYDIIGNEKIVDILPKEKWTRKKINLEDGKSNFKSRLKNNTLDVVFEVPGGFEKNIFNFKQPEIIIHYNNMNFTSNVYSRTKNQIIEIQSDYRKKLSNKLKIKELEANALSNPFTFIRSGTASKREQNGLTLGLLLALAIIMMTLSGAMYPALDIGAGEKERGTLETLLISPTTRFSLALGKSAVIASTGIVTIILSLFSIFLIGIFVEFPLNILDLFLCFIVSMPVSMIFSPILLSISVYASSYKEAQNYLTAILMVVMLPVMFILNPSYSLAKMSWIPVVNSVFAIREIAQNKFDVFYIIPIYIVGIILTGLGILVCAKIYQKKGLT